MQGSWASAPCVRQRDRRAHCSLSSERLFTGVIYAFGRRHQITGRKMTYGDLFPQTAFHGNDPTIPELRSSQSSLRAAGFGLNRLRQSDPTGLILV
ncbi:hypothetical protein SBA3_1680023 [Candidatus Sulfopaludibacter sp. SbA3]|nr:hypothetical protein SBA3_1680023 [Candidatus Sulfopaludibacter sp. SbA3]